MKEKFRVGIETLIQLDIKPRTQNGLLFSVHGKSSSMILQLHNGSLVLTINNGDGQFNVTYTPSAGENFCDGEWRTVEAYKSKFIASLTVDGIAGQPTIGQSQFISTETTRPLFLGSHPRLDKARDIISRQPYHGCIRNVKINSELQHVKVSQAVGHVNYGVCYLN